MGIRREKVILELQDEFSSGMARAAVATELLDKKLDSLSGRAVVTARSQRTVNRELDDTSASARRAEASIDKLSGRMRILADVVALIGPAVSPIGAVGVAGIGGVVNQLSVAVLAGGAAIAAFQGVGTALEAVNKAALEPTVENLEAARMEMARLSPAARQAVSAMTELKPLLVGIRDAGAEELMPGFVAMLDSLASRGGDITRIVTTLNATLSDLLTSGAQSLSSSEWDEFFDFLAEDSAQTLRSLGATVGNLAQGFSELWMAFDPLSDGFSDWFEGWSARFASWADGLSETERFQDFVDYVHETGPEVAEAFTSIGDALLAVMEAAAPLGGPVLNALSAVADVVSAIARSDIGTPIMAGVAALAAFNRTAAITSALSARMGGAGLMGLVTGSAAYGAGRTAVSGTRSTIATMRADLATLAAGYATAGAASQRESARMAASAGRIKAAMSGVGRAAGPLAGVGLLATGAADGLGATNTAALALMGSFAGPWGAAVGAGVGVLMDMRKTSGDAFDALEQLGDALDRVGDTATLTEVNALNDAMTIAAEKVADLREMRENPFTSGVGGFFGSIKNDVEDTFGKSDVEEAEEALAGYEEQLARVEVQAAERAELEAFDAAVVSTGIAAGETAREFVGLGASVSDAEVSLGEWLAQLEEQTQALRDFRDNAREAGRKGLAQGLIAELQKAGPEGALRMRELANATDQEIGRANRAWRAGQREVSAYQAEMARLPRRVVTDIEQNGMPRSLSDIDRLAQKYKLTPKQIRTLVALAGVDAAEGTLERLSRPRSTTVTVHMVTVEDRVRYGGQTRNAGGGFVPKTGLPYADRHPYLLADGEGVTTNRHGETDRFRDVIMGINAGKSRAEIKGMLADGGFAGRATASLRPGDDWRRFDQALDRLARSIDKAGKGFDQVGTRLERIRQKMDAAGDTSVSQFTPSLFGDSGSPWASTSGAGPVGALQDASAGLLERQRLQRQLARAGLSGDAYAAAMEGSNDDLRALLAGGQVKAFQKQYQTYTRLQTATASQAGQYAYGKQATALVDDARDRRQSVKEQRETNRRLARVEKAVQRVGGDLADGINRSASRARRNRRRGGR